MTLPLDRAREIAADVFSAEGATLSVSVRCVQAGYAAALARSTGTLTEADIEAEWNRQALRGDKLASWRELGTHAAQRYVIAFARSIASRVAGPDVERVRREAAREALTWAANFVLSKNDSSAIRNYRDHNYPLPAPVPSVTLSDGSVVTWRTDIFDGGGWERNNPKALHGCQLISTSENIREVLTERTDTGADFDAVKSLAARVGDK